MNFGLNEAPAIDLLRDELLRLLALVRGGALDPARAKLACSVLLPDFGVNQATLTPAHVNAVEDVALLLLEHRALEIDMIIGRASQTGNEANNLSLSEARAGAVRDELERLHVQPPPPAIGVGSAEPIQDIPRVESELNRSVEIALWYDLSYHFTGEDNPAEHEHPAEFWRSYMPGSRYDRAALLLGLVYDNIDDLFSPSHATAVGTMNALTIWEDDDMVRTRALLGYYKQTGSDAAAIQADIVAFNTLLSDHGLSPSDFTGEEISDAEHFATGAVMTMVPILGLVVGPAFSVVWEGGQGAIGAVKTGSSDSLKYNMEQLIGADLAGMAYGMTRTYVP